MLEGTLKIISFQSPCRGQGHLPLDQVTQSPVQLGLEYCQGEGSHSFSGQAVLGPHYPPSEEFLPYIWFKSPLFQLEAITPCPITTRLCKKSLSSFLTGAFRYWKAALRSSWSLLFSKTNYIRTNYRYARYGGKDEAVSPCLHCATDMQCTSC